jgi:hypothetical protein
MADTKHTAAGEVVLPVERVELTGRALRRADGTPLVVACEYLDEDRLLSIIEAAPGHTPVLGIPEQTDSAATARALLQYAPGLITASCVLVGPDGAEQRPAFHFGPDPKDGSLPGRFLSAAEKVRLIVVILQVCGFVGGPADSLKFPDGVGAGRTSGVGHVDAGEGDGNAAGDTDSRGSEGVEAPADAGARG